MPSKKFLKESQDLTFRALEDMGDSSAYDIMDVVAEGLEGNEAFALRQRVSGACSELHRDNKIHQVGRKINPSSGETVKVYRVNEDGSECECGECPGGGEAGYKAKYETLLAQYQELLGETALLCNSCCILLCDHCKSRRKNASASIAA